MLSKSDLSFSSTPNKRLAAASTEPWPVKALTTMLCFAGEKLIWRVRPERLQNAQPTASSQFPQACHRLSGLAHMKAHCQTSDISLQASGRRSLLLQFGHPADSLEIVPYFPRLRRLPLLHGVLKYLPLVHSQGLWAEPRLQANCRVPEDRYPDLHFVPVQGCRRRRGTVDLLCLQSQHSEECSRNWNSATLGQA